MSNAIDPWDWAGVVVRTRSGVLYVMEIEDPNGELDLKVPERVVPWDQEPIVGWVRREPAGPPVAQISISGEVKATRLTDRERPDWSDIARVVRGPVPGAIIGDAPPEL